LKPSETDVDCKFAAFVSQNGKFTRRPSSVRGCCAVATLRLVE
jgi:hypothetical protein